MKIKNHKIKYSLPEEVEDFIFKDLLKGFQVCPDHEAVRNNLYADEAEVKNYLGVYFPRSFVEAYEICTDLFAEKNIDSMLKDKKGIYILDIGSGSGGNLMGLLWRLKEMNFINKVVGILSIDGNNISLDYQKKIIKIFFPCLALETRKENFISEKDFKIKMNRILSEYGFQFDIVTSFKFVSEMQSCDLYKIIVKLVSRYLKEDGLFILNDLTCEYSNSNGELFIPRVMNFEIIPFLKQSRANLKCIIPLSCAFWYQDCEDCGRCFQQKIFSVTYRNYPSLNRPTNVIYKVFTHNVLANKILSKIERKDIYKISTKHKNFCICDKGKFVKLKDEISKSQYVNAPDAFSLFSLR